MGLHPRAGSRGVVRRSVSSAGHGGSTMPPALPPLTEWETFYVIIGSSAAALTGLQFVVIALGAEAKVLGGEPEMRAFGTPTIVHFCVVLLPGAILSTPGQTPASLGLCLSACGLSGLGY